MISGFVLELSYPFHATYITYLRKRVKRIFIPYIFWSAVYYFFVYTKHNINFLQTLFSGSASYQLYFIPTLLIFYLIFPLFHKYYSNLSNKWVFIALGILQVLLLYYDYYIYSEPWPYVLKIAILNYYLFLIGIFSYHHIKRILALFNRFKLFTFALTILAGLYVFYEAKNLYLKTHNYIYFYSQWRPAIFVYTIFASSSLFYFFDKLESSHSVIKSLSKLSFFVFFIHVIILEIVWKLIGFKIFHYFHGSYIEQFWFDPIFFIVVVIISFSLAFLVHKIPNLPKITS